MLITELRRRALEAYNDEQQRQQALEDIENTGYLKRALKRTLNIEANPSSPEMQIDGLVFRGSGDQHNLSLHVRMPDGSWAYVSGLTELGAHITKMKAMLDAAPVLDAAPLEPPCDTDAILAHDIHDAVIGMLRESDATAAADNREVLQVPIVPATAVAIPFSRIAAS
jgi:hypothetical protein